MAPAPLDVPPRDETTHGVAHEDDSRVGILPALGAPAFECRVDDGREARPL